MVGLLNVTNLVASSGYAAIFVLSILQSCCVPTSSELTLGFAGVLAAQGKLSLPAVIVVGAAGEVIGAYLAWAIGRYGGRAFIERYGKYVLMSVHDLDRAQGWYERHERWGVFGSRLLPVIRNFVAVPAGVAEVPLVSFGVLTALGSLLWDGAMALIGYEIGGSWRSIMKGFSDAGYLLGAATVAAIAFVVWHRWRAFHRAPTGPPIGAGAASEQVASADSVVAGQAAESSGTTQEQVGDAPRASSARRFQPRLDRSPDVHRRPASPRGEIEAALLPERYRRHPG